MDRINNVQNLDSILFYTGTNSVVAAEYTEKREFGKPVDKYGTLTRGSDSSIYFSNFPNVKYKERNTVFSNMNDLYTETLSYVLSNKEDDERIIGNSYITNNRYNAIYTYETDLDNNFDNARSYVKDNLEEFLIGLNNQKFNKEGKYGDNYEVSSIKIDQTYFKWYPENTIAYYNTEVSYESYTYLYYFINDVNKDIYDGEMTEQLTAYIDEYLAANNKTELSPTDYIHSYSYTGQISTETEVPYIIGGNYYSYVRQSYATIDYKLAEKIDNKLTYFENKYNNDASIYAYYMYDCNSDINMLLTTLSLGVKESTFKIGFDSKFNKWFDNIINIHAELNENDTIAKITSYKDDEIFSIFKNSTERITGDNVIINKDETFEFKTNSAVDLESNINILTPYSIDTLDLSPIKTKVGTVLDLTENPWIESGIHMKSLILDDGDNTTKSNIEKIFGINEIESLEYLDISNINKFFRTPAIDKLENLKVFKAENSNIDSFRPHQNNVLYDVELPATVKSIKLNGNQFVSGELKVGGELKEFDGKFKYEPNTTLNSLTLRHIDDELSYKLVDDWYNVLNDANALNNVLYLELIDIDWKNVNVNKLINLKHFDLCPDFSGNISITGNGNYHWLTRDEYQNVLKAYGINAFAKGNNISNKIYKNLDIKLAKRCEEFEFSLKVLNKSVQAYNAANEGVYQARLYKDTLGVNFSGYYYDTSDNYKEYKISPYGNRAANALLDIIYKDNEDFTFVKDVLEDVNGNDVSNYAYCKLNRSIDTANSDEIKNIKAGDILLFNGDTIMIFFKDTVNTVYEYTKLGSIVDETILVDGRLNVSSIEHWFDNNNAATLRFIPSERKPVVQDITISASRDNIQSDDIDNVIVSVSIPASIVTAIANNEIENPNIIVEADSEIVTIVAKENYNYEIVHNFTFTRTETVKIFAYAEANREDTEVSIELTLESDVIPSTVEDNILLINSPESTVSNGILTISERNDAEYDPATRTLIIK